MVESSVDRLKKDLTEIVSLCKIKNDLEKLNNDFFENPDSDFLKSLRYDLFGEIEHEEYLDTKVKNEIIEKLKKNHS